MPTPRHLLASMTAKEYAELLAFASLEPIGLDREDWRHVVSASAIAASGGGKLSQEELELISPAWSEAKEPINYEELAEIIRKANDDAKQTGD